MTISLGERMSKLEERIEKLETLIKNFIVMHDGAIHYANKDSLWGRDLGRGEGDVDWQIRQGEAQQENDNA